MNEILFEILICFLAGAGAGLGTGFAGMSAATVISPMLITFLGLPAYDAIGIALASDVLASAVSARTYAKNGSIDIRNGLVMMCGVLCMTLVGSWLSSFLPNNTLGGFSVVMTLVLGLRFLVLPVTSTQHTIRGSSRSAQIIKGALGGACIGLICGFFGAGGGMMMLFVLTSLLGYEVKTAVGTSVFVIDVYKRQGLARVDFFVEEGTGKVLLNEINTLPGFTSISMYPKLMMDAGDTYASLLDSLIALAFERAEARHG